MRIPTRTAWKLRKALAALVERGVEGEAEVAKRKLARLESRYDFSAGEMDSLFSGTFQRSGSAVFLTDVPAGELMLSGFAKWAIENGAKIPALWRNGELWVEADRETLPRLKGIVQTVLTAFPSLWRSFADRTMSPPTDRQAFMLGLYDGMMSDAWPNGKPLPASTPKKEKRGKGNKATGLTLHPYSVALDLGQGIRFKTSIEELTAQLTDTVAQLAEGTP